MRGNCTHSMRDSAADRSVRLSGWLAALLGSLLLGSAPAAAAEFDPEQPTVLITGANRGLGLEFARQYAARGWNVIASVRLALRVAKTPDAEDFTEFVYTAERSGRSVFRPGIGSNERILAECLDDLAQLVSEREALAAALARHAS